MIVADTNLLASLFLPSAGTAVAEQVLRTDSHWSVPLLWRSELRNVLATAMRTRRLELNVALEILETAGAIVRGNEHLVPDPRVMALSAASGCSAYDCEFVALAEDLDAPLVTWDRQVLKAFPARAVAPERFVAA